MMNDNQGDLRSHTAARVRLAVGGMSCGGCASRVEGRLLALPGVMRAEVDLRAALAVVTFDPQQITPAGLAGALSDTGFQARLVD